MGRYDGVDLRLTEDGDLAIERGDLSIVRKQEYVTQSARNRIKLSDPDWYDFRIKDIGANLEDLFGLPNTPDTARMGIDKITEALTRDGLISSEDLFIKPVPVSRYVIGFFVFIRFTNVGKPLFFEVLFNLETGLMIRGVDNDSTR